MSKTPYCFVRAEEFSCTNSKKTQRSLQKFYSQEENREESYTGSSDVAATHFL